MIVCAYNCAPPTSIPPATNSRVFFFFQLGKVSKRGPKVHVYILPHVHKYTSFVIFSWASIDSLFFTRNPRNIYIHFKVLQSSLFTILFRQVVSHSHSFPRARVILAVARSELSNHNTSKSFYGARYSTSSSAWLLF